VYKVKQLNIILIAYPIFIKSYLIHNQEQSVTYNIVPVEPLQIWVSAFLRLKSNEQDDVMAWLIRDGIKGLLRFVEEQKRKDNSNE